MNDAPSQSTVDDFVTARARAVARAAAALPPGDRDRERLLAHARGLVALIGSNPARFKDYCARPALLAQDRLDTARRRERELAQAVGELAEAVTQAGVTIATGFPDQCAVVAIRGELLRVPPDWERTLAEARKITLRIDSPGGCCRTAFAMIEGLWAHPDGTAVVERFAGSAACYLLQGARRRLARPGARLLLHAPSTLLAGTARTLRAAADALDADRRRLTVWLSHRTGQPVRRVCRWLAGGDFVFTAQEALRLGLIEAISDAPPT